MYRLKIANVMGMDMDKAQHGMCIADALSGIENQEAFVEYCRDKKNGIEYENRVEKLDTLATMYKRLQEKAKLPNELAMNFSSQLTHKVEQARTYVKNQIELGNTKPFSSLAVDGNKFFTDKEIMALSGLGSASVIIELSEQHKLKDNLVQLFLSKFVKKSKYNALTNRGKKVQALVGGFGCK